MTDVSFWRKCSTCKKEIGFLKPHYICSVSTCNGQRTGYVFCSVICCEAHFPGARHRDASAIETISPSFQDWTKSQQSTSIGTKKIIPTSVHNQDRSKTSQNTLPRDVLIVASKLKDYIRAHSEMNTSGSVVDVLSDLVRQLCDEAIQNAYKDGRKTVMDRDFRKSVH